MKLVEKEGPKALWRGLPPTLWRDVPFSAFYWMGYEEIKSTLATTDLSDFNKSFLSGATAGMIAAAVTTPFDVVKSRRQVDAGRDVPMFRDIRVPAMLRQIVHQEGYQGLFRGLTPRIAKVAPSCAIMISSYELGKSFFANSRSEL
jgi:solute carrier family 25 protein 39/40